jgi:molecular chaperone DnaJ
MGMKVLSSGRRAGKGDLKVEFKVQMPKYLSVNQRTILEMLADEMGDKTAQRVINPGKMREDIEREEKRGAGEHDGEGFLKNAWHNITGQHKQASEEGKREDEKKKGSGSG